MLQRALNLKEKEIFESLKGVIDPELMVNIVDLGLVYDVRLDFENKKINITMTLTSPGCPLGDVIMEDAKQIAKSSAYADFEVEVNLVWEPAWTLDSISEKGKNILGRN